MKSTSFHKSNLGSFGDHLPCDIDGYVHTTQKGWMSSNMDAMAWRGYSLAEKRDRCKEMAEDAREAVAQAEADVRKFQNA